MRTTIVFFAGVIASILVAAAAFRGGTPVDYTFTYQGQLRNAGALVNGPVDLRITLWDSDVAGGQVGAINNYQAVPITDGRFALGLNFGATAFDGSNRWVQLEFRDPAGTGDYLALAPRDKIAATPYSLYSLNGKPGPQGPAGIDGPQGPAGIDGPLGATGSQGIQGETGAAGAQGLTGSTGLTGATGTGITGVIIESDILYFKYLYSDGTSSGYITLGNVVGPQGPTGGNGSNGEAGLQGPQGSAGIDGALVSIRSDMIKVTQTINAVMNPYTRVVTAPTAGFLTFHFEAGYVQKAVDSPFNWQFYNDNQLVWEALPTLWHNSFIVTVPVTAGPHEFRLKSALSVTGSMTLPTIVEYNVNTVFHVLKLE